MVKGFMNRVGIGYDVHPLVENRKLFLGGVELPTTRAWRAIRTPMC